MTYIQYNETMGYVYFINKKNPANNAYWAGFYVP